jgi:hypothetical protein
MKEIVLNVTQTEYEILTTIGVVSNRPVGAKERFNVVFGFPSEYTMDELMEGFEKAISFQESDSGDWLRAKQWRDAKSDLLGKIRRAYLVLVRDI